MNLQRAEFDKYYVFCRKLLDGAELMKVKEVLEENQEITKHSYGVSSVAHHLYIIYNSLQIYPDSNKHTCI